MFKSQNIEGKPIMIYESFCPICSKDAEPVRWEITKNIAIRDTNLMYNAVTGNTEKKDSSCLRTAKGKKYRAVEAFPSLNGEEYFLSAMVQCHRCKKEFPVLQRI